MKNVKVLASPTTSATVLENVNAGPTGTGVNWFLHCLNIWKLKVPIKPTGAVILLVNSNFVHGLKHLEAFTVNEVGVNVEPGAAIAGIATEPGALHFRATSVCGFLSLSSLFSFLHCSLQLLSSKYLEFEFINKASIFNFKLS